jgi:hypothetical protein
MGKERVVGEDFSFSGRVGWKMCLDPGYLWLSSRKCNGIFPGGRESQNPSERS